MPGVINKKNTITNMQEVIDLGGFRLVFAVLAAKPGTPFLTVYMKATS